MLRSILFAFSLLIVFGCTNDPRQSDKALESTPDVKKGEQQIPLAGNWLNENYYNSIIEDKSPKRAQKICEFCFIKIPANTSQSSQILLNFHEAITDVSLVTKNGQYQLWENQDGNPVRLIDSITMKTNNKIKIGDDYFIKINAMAEDLPYKVLEQILFKGTYLTEEGTYIGFTKTGEISGLANYKYYAPVIDYNDIGLDVDQIKLGKTKAQMETFAFKYKKNNLQLYTVKCKSRDASGICVEVGFGEQKYFLKKSK